MKLTSPRNRKDFTTHRAAWERTRTGQEAEGAGAGEWATAFIGVSEGKAGDSRAVWGWFLGIVSEGSKL